MMGMRTPKPDETIEKAHYVVHVIATAHFNLYVKAEDRDKAATGALRLMEDHPDGNLASLVNLRMRVSACDELPVPEEL
jgi:hypothetical protein